jgi:hypothetical protein
VTDLDVTRVDGPHSPERTVAAARLMADAVRYLNHATLGTAPGIGYPGDVDGVLGSIEGAAGGLQQTLKQLEVCLRRDLNTGRLRMDDRSQDPAAAVRIASDRLAVAKSALETLQVNLKTARRFTSAMSLAPEEEPDA